MKVSTKGRYALRMLLDLAEDTSGEFVRLKDIALRQGVSKQYLEQIITHLNASGLLRANRGKQGGYMLAKPPSEITVGWVLRFTEGSIAPVACLDDEINQCPRVATCKTLRMWEKLDRIINDYLDSVTLQDLIDQHITRDSNIYVI